MEKANGIDMTFERKRSAVCWLAADGEYLNILQLARENGCSWDEQTCWNAAGGGHLELLRWARGNGCPWMEYTCSAAAQEGHMEMLQWLRAGSVRLSLG